MINLFSRPTTSFMPTILNRTAVPQRVVIGTPENLQHWEDARVLVREYFVWTLERIGKEAMAAEGSQGMELLRLPRVYGPPSGRLFLARVDGEPAGVAAVRLLSDDVAELKRVYVTRAARGQGVASQLLDACIDEARYLGVERMRLETHSVEMRIAMDMYKRRGFREIGHYSGHFNHVPEAVAMELVLG